MTPVELTLIALNALNKAKGINIRLTNVKEDSEGGVDFHIIWPDGYEDDWGWPDAWIKNPDHEYSSYVMRNSKSFAGLDDETKIMAKMMCYMYCLGKDEGHIK